MASVTFSGTGELTSTIVNAGLGTATAITVIIEGYTSIGLAAFLGKTQITSLTIGNSVISIGEIAFWLCSNLSSVTFGNSVISIAGAAFKGCTSLASITLGNSVTSIGDSGFEGCISLASITLGNSVESIGQNAFQSCSLTSITIGNSVTSISVNAFQNSGLTTVYIANGKVISGITFQSPASGVSFFGKIVTTIAPAPAPAAPSATRIPIRSLFTNNAQVYYKPHSLASGGIGSVRNCRFKSKKT